VLRKGLERYPNDTEMLVLASRVAQFQPAPFLALRYLEEAQLVLEKKNASAEVQGDVAAERSSCRSHGCASTSIPTAWSRPPARPRTLRQQFAENRRRFGDNHLKLKDADIDFELARGFVDAGLIDRAEPLFMRARREAESSVELTLQLGKLVSKRGDAGRAAQILREALDNEERTPRPRRPSLRRERVQAGPRPWATPTRWPAASTTPAGPGSRRPAAGSA
jgi:hypothetical protein